MEWVGPIKIIGEHLEFEDKVPLATYESPLWPSTQRGARVTQLSGGIQTTLLDERMTRSVTFRTLNAQAAHKIVQSLTIQRFQELSDVVTQSSRFARLLKVHAEILGDLLFLRFEFSTGDASGHNMVTKASQALQTWILQQYPALSYASISGNYCCDKKVSAVNGILGRGKHVICEVTIPYKLCRRFLKTTPQAICDLNQQKNYIGSILAGSLRSANAHFANTLLASYLATGQDAANIVEGSQGMTYACMRGDDLYFSVKIPHLIVGTIGNGKHLDFVEENLQRLGCLGLPTGEGAQRLAMVIAATVLCTELSLLAAQTNEGELMDAHLRLERKVEEGTLV